ncbi:UDP-2,4-diacetamido-2,4,6-trideoxy-beta-L-altropyranose hydrolase [Effusibacillus lacus]|uniref:UDP-2,4-diacetamido-2,4,6-trideoxy-beta-L-altropyranose hydrolase n=2 Tax=Effusibacillus lacus TaxID=1348429 RepID=A0A292YKA7_9BACL|nr:UDP-2,4-diacetamido-2,4,6-trideoxy-beta-L-altropyranose hydrolase [Effusibacillus lacus]
MHIFFRVDSSQQIGSGHLMRCLTLATELKERHATVSFISRELPGHMCNYVESKGFQVARLPYSAQAEESLRTPNSTWLGVSWQLDAEETKEVLSSCVQGVDWLIVDHYALDWQWESYQRSEAKKIMVIDDLADRRHDCDLLLDQNLFEDLEIRYDKLVSTECLKFLGPRYALLRKEFLEARTRLRQRDGQVNRILVFFGGSDITNETAKAIKAIQSLNSPQIQVDVVVGSSNPRKDEIRDLCYSIPNVNYHCQIENMAELMAAADLAIGAGGTATWERCYLGLPALVVILAENQIQPAQAAAKEELVINLGWHYEIDELQLAGEIRRAIENPGLLKKMGQNAFRLMGDTSTRSEVARAILGG